MADVDVKRIVHPKSNFSPLLIIGLVHFTCVRVYLFFAPLITRLWKLYWDTLRIVTLPYQCCCTMMLLTILWPFIACVVWFYVWIRVCEWYGLPVRAVPGVATLMGPLDMQQALPAPAGRRAAVRPAPAPAPAPAYPAGSGVRRRTAAPARAEGAASSVSADSEVTFAGNPTSSTASQATAGARMKETTTSVASTSAEAASASTPAEAAGATAASGAKPKRSARDRSPDGWFGPPPPEEGGPEPPYVPYDPDFVDPTDYLPEEELAQYKFYKRRTPFRRVP